MGVLVAVGVGVAVGGGVYVGRKVIVGVAGTLSPTGVSVSSKIIRLVGVAAGWFKAICPQACTSINTTNGTINLLHTLAVYHKILSSLFILSLREYGLVRIPIQSFRW
jgi:nucleoside recognition membrane protein YjiH